MFCNKKKSQSAKQSSELREAIHCSVGQTESSKKPEKPHLKQPQLKKICMVSFNSHFILFAFVSFFPHPLAQTLGGAEDICNLIRFTRMSVPGQEKKKKKDSILSVACMF